jgi:YVTN family beta-propeller protein
VIDTATNSVIGGPIAVGPYPSGIVFNAQGTRAYVTNWSNGFFGTVSVIDTSTNSAIATIAVDRGPRGIALGSGDTRLYVAQQDGSISVIDTSSNTVIGSIPVMNDAFELAIDDARSLLYLSTSTGTTVQVVDLTIGAVIASIPVGAYPGKMAIDTTARRLYVPNWFSDTLSIIDTTTNTVLATIPNIARPNAVALSSSPPPVASPIPTGGVRALVLLCVLLALVGSLALRAKRQR